MIDPNASAVWELLSTTSNIIDGKYFLSGSQANSTNAFLIVMQQEVVNGQVVNFNLIQG